MSQTVSTGRAVLPKQVLLNKELKGHGDRLREVLSDPQRRPDQETLAAHLAEWPGLFAKMQAELSDWLSQPAGHMILKAAGHRGKGAIDPLLTARYSAPSPWVPVGDIGTATIQPQELINPVLLLQLKDSQAMGEATSGTEQVTNWHAVRLLDVRVTLLSGPAMSGAN